MAFSSFSGFFPVKRGYEHRIYESWRMRASKRLRGIMHRIRNKGAPHGWIREDLWARMVEFWQQEDFKKLKQVNKRNRASSTGGSLHTGGSTTYEATRERMDAYEAKLKRLQDERQATIDAGGPVPPHHEAEVWERVAGGRKRGRVYGMGVVPSHKYPPLFSDPDDDDTASGPPDLREQVTLLNREISQQAEAHAQSLAAVEAVYAEKVRTLESTVQTQSQEVSDLRCGVVHPAHVRCQTYLPTASTATTASCSVTDSCSVTNACSITNSPITA
ncbi:hypothetical protein PIB30_058591 [Stylosanthes scabra]|uniref:Transposase n=1 Tax=Stylosanthes scabra TaxID=79078 RepID=A0ABU6UKJ7_9FABA|nr:hypothetical protein [Stylosanthes scabra]